MIDHKYGACRAFLLIFVLVAICYGNTLHSSWHFDDYSNILENPRVHLETLDIESIVGTFFSGADQKLYRPLTCFSFALNWYFGKDNVFGYRIVNISIHFFSACVLFLAFNLLSRAPKTNDTFKKNACSISLLAAAVWAVHPIQTQAVTYVVQRMAAMAALFYVAGIFFYLKARFADLEWKRALFYSCCAISWLFAILSKENAAVMPLSIFLVEIVFFSDIRTVFRYKKTIVFLCSVSATAVLYLLLTDKLQSTLKLYDARPFTLVERLLTEPRVVLQYFSQLFYPVDSRFSFEHDIEISKSLFSPWETFPAIAINVTLILWAVFRIEKTPVLSFAILFFYINHLVESSIIPLELIFEHRNYLPSMFLFLPVSIGLFRLLDRLKKSNRILWSIAHVSVILVLMSLCVGTLARNRVWKTEKELWEDVYMKYPELARPYQKLAEYYKGLGYYDVALKLYEKALPLKSQTPMQNKFVCLNNMANIYLAKEKYDVAMDLYQKALIVNREQVVLTNRTIEEYRSILYNMAFAMVCAGEWDRAERISDKLVDCGGEIGKHLTLKGFILLKQNRVSDSLQYFSDALKLSPNDKNNLLYIGYVYMKLSEFGKSSFFLRKAHEKNPEDIVILLFNIENSVRSNNKPMSDLFMNRLFERNSIGQIGKVIEEYKMEKNARLNISAETINPEIAKFLANLLAN